MDGAATTPPSTRRARAAQSPRRQLSELESVLKALADQNRLRIVALLIAGEVCVCHIHETLDMPQPKASRHLAYLRRSGLVAARKDGLWVHYRLAHLDDPVMRAVVGAVAHATGHLDVISRDRQRLGNRIGAAPLDGAGLPSVSCCQLPSAADRSR